MSRIADLEQYIRKSYEIIREYEKIIRTSSDPKAKQQAQRVKKEQWELISTYWGEYNSLCTDLGYEISYDIMEIATSIQRIEKAPLESIGQHPFSRVQRNEFNERTSIPRTRVMEKAGKSLYWTTNESVAEDLPAANGREKLPPGSTLTWLHLSDLHFPRSNSRGNRVRLREIRKVLDTLIHDLEERVNKDGLRPDFAVFTGDIAQSGHPDEYVGAAQFLDRVLQITELDRERLFVVPGNHDIDWGTVEEDFVIAKGCAGLKTRDAVNAFLDPCYDRTSAFQKFSAYESFVQTYFGGKRTYNAKDYFYVCNLDLGFRVAVLGLNSAWMSGFCRDANDNVVDQGNLLIGEAQVDDALRQDTGSDIRVALCHHPLDWLQEFDRIDVETSLLRECHFLLHGHLHHTQIRTLVDPDSETIIIPAGACYKRRDNPNTYNLVQLVPSEGRGTIFMRQYSRNGFWAEDTLSYKAAQGGRFSFSFPKVQHQTVAPPPRPKEVITLRPSLAAPKPPVDLDWFPKIPQTILIPAGEFWLGSADDDADAEDNERPRHRVFLAAYRISKYPITNLQYRLFVQATNYALPDHWENSEIPPDKETHPVVNVDFGDAQAYCHWLTQRTGRIYRLPTEEEWEKAARGAFPETRRYPWGNEWNAKFCNTREAGLDGTTPVEAYSQKGRSPYGVVDLSGNVAEWTCSWYGQYHGSADESGHYGRIHRVVRGGGWVNSSEWARASFRGHYKPDTWRPYLGFRVALTEL